MILAKYRKHSTSVIRIGLGLVFLANSYTAFVSPDEFNKLIDESFLVDLLPASLDLFVKFIGVSDAIVATLLLIGRGQKYVAVYASLWLVGVMTVIGTKEPADLLEHFGGLSMAIYLILNGLPK